MRSILLYVSVPILLIILFAASLVTGARAENYIPLNSMIESPLPPSSGPSMSIKSPTTYLQDVPPMQAETPTRKPLDTPTKIPTMAPTEIRRRYPTSTRIWWTLTPTEHIVESFLTIQPVGSLQLGEYPVIDAQLVTEEGEPIFGQILRIYLNHSMVKEVHTNSLGKIYTRIDRLLPTGNHQIRVVFGGSSEYLPTEDFIDISVTPAILEVHTIPQLPGVQFSLNDKVFVSEDDGIARIEVNKAGVFSLNVKSFPTSHPTIRAKFRRWELPIFTSVRDVFIPRDEVLSAGFEVIYNIPLHFVDLDGNPVDSGRISSVTVKDDSGAIYTWKNGKELWLQGNQIGSERIGIQTGRIPYTVERVIVDGTNVYKQRQQYYYASDIDAWEIPLAFYSVRFSGRDLLFGLPNGSGINLTYPDGKEEYLEFDINSTITIGPLARGLYRVKLEGVSGFTRAVSIVLQGGQDINLSVFSYLDIGVLIAVILIVCVMLFVVFYPERLYGLRSTISFLFGRLSRFLNR